MAYVPNPEDQNSPQQLTGANGQPQTSGGGSGSSSLGTPQGSTSVPASTQAPPVQNLSAYLKANAPQAVQQGQNIANNLSNTVNQVTGDINSAQQGFNKTVQDQNVTPDSALVERAASNPSGFVQNPNDVSAFQQQYNANYSGPTSFESSDYYPGLNTEVQNAVGKAPDITQPSGLAQLARGQEKNPTVGQSNLDALLLQENPDAVKPISEVIPRFGALRGQLGQVASDSNTAIQQAIQNDQAAKAGVQSRFLTGDNAVVPAWQKALQDELTGAQGKTNEYNQSINNITQQENDLQPTLVDALKSISEYNAQAKTYNPSALNLSQESTLPELGYDLSGLSKTYNPINAPELGSVASKNDYDTQAALNELLGGNLSNLNPNDISKAGTFNTPGKASLPINESIQGLQAELAAAQKGFTNNGALQYKGTPSNSIVTNNDLPPGWSIVPDTFFQGTNDGHGHGTNGVQQPAGTKHLAGPWIAVPPGSKGPNGQVITGQVPDTGSSVITGSGSISPIHGTISPPTLGAPQYYSNAPLNTANTNISALIKYLQGLS